MWTLLETKPTSTQSTCHKEVLQSLVTGWLNGHFKQVVAGVVFDNTVVALVELSAGTGNEVVHASLKAEAAPELTPAFIHHECEKVLVVLKELK